MLESQFDGLEFVLGTGGEVGDGAVFDFALLAEGLAEEDPVIGLAVGGGLGPVQIHSEHNIITYNRKCKHNIDILSGYTFGAKYSYYVDYQLLAHFEGRNIRCNRLHGGPAAGSCARSPFWPRACAFNRDPACKRRSR